MTRRGQIIRDNTIGSGIVFVDGYQYPFHMERVWQAFERPAVGMMVDVTFHPDYGIQHIRSIPPATLFPAQPILPDPYQPAQAAYPSYNAGPSPTLVSALALCPEPTKLKIDIAAIIGVALLVVGWYLIPSLRIGLAGFGLDITFAQIIATMGNISAINPGGTSGNILFSFLAVCSLAAPFLHYLWKNRAAFLAGCFPLALMTVAALITILNVNRATQSAGQLVGDLFGKEAGNFASGFLGGMVHVEAGVYLSIIAACFVAFNALRQFMHRDARVLPSTR